MARKALNIGSILTIAVAIVVWNYFRQTPAQITAEAQAALPAGTPHHAVVDYFKGRADYVHWFSEDRRVQAIFRDVQNTVVIETDVSVFVDFDDELKVRQVSSRASVRGLP